MLDLSLPLAFTVGLFSTLHCVGMCGGVMGALSYSLPARFRSHGRRLLLFLLVFNLGRILSYGIAGALVGGAGGALVEALALSDARFWLRWVAGLIMVGIGLHIAGWFPQFARIERLGVPIWRHLEPLARRLMPVDSALRAGIYGMLWGWLPCGLVYTMLMTSATQASPLKGALFMGVFGIGTLPSMLAAGLYVGRISAWSGRPGLRELVGLSVVVMGLLTLFFEGTRTFPS